MAVAHFAHSMRLSPLDQRMFQMQLGTAVAHFLAARDHEASLWAQRSLHERPNWHPTLRIAIASNALAGRLDWAREIMASFRKIDPTFRVSNVREIAPFQPTDAARIEDGLRRAGLPE